MQAAQTTLTPTQTTTAPLLPTKNAAELGALCDNLPAHFGGTFALAIVPDGSLLASGGLDKTVKLWSLPDGKLLKTLDKFQWWANIVKFSPDGKLLMIGYQNVVQLWKLPQIELIQTLQGKHMTLDKLAVSPDSKLLATGGVNERIIDLWALPGGKHLITLNQETDTVNALDISPDGKILASAGLTTAYLWSLPEGKLLKSFKRTRISNADMIFSPDGKLLISAGGTDKTLKLWALPEGILVTCLFDPEATESDTQGARYRVTGNEGLVREYTLPCGAPIPAGAICTCNCAAIPASCSCVGFTGGSSSHYWYPN